MSRILSILPYCSLLMGCFDQTNSSTPQSSASSSSDIVIVSSTHSSSAPSSSSSTADFDPSTLSKSGLWSVASYPAWKKEQYPLSKIPWSSISHLRYAFAVPDYDGSLQVDEELLGQLSDSAHAHGKSALLAIGGGGDGSAYLGDISAQDSLIRKMVNECARLVDKYKLQGVVMDWELWPSGNQPDTALENGLVRVMKELHTTMHARGVHVGMDVFGSSWYGVHTKNENFQYTDYLNIMTIDDAGSWSSKPSHHASVALVQSAVAYWLRRAGADWNKRITITIPHYGYEFDRGFKTGESSKVRFKPYHQILSEFPGAAETDSLSNDSVIVFHQSRQSLADKAKIIHEKGLLGTVNWEITFDSADPQTSLMDRAYQLLHP